MRTKIYQINPERDANHVKYTGLERIVDASIYDEVFSGDIDETDLADIRVRFYTVGHPLYRGSPLSLSDVVVNDNGSFYLDADNFRQIEFDESQTYKPDNLMRIVYVEPHRPAFEAEIVHDFDAMVKAVGGMIEPVDLEYNICLLENAYSKYRGLEINRRFFDGTTVSGPFFVLGSEEDGFRALTQEETDRYLAVFSEPEKIIQEDDLWHDAPPIPSM